MIIGTADVEPRAEALLTEIRMSRRADRPLSLQLTANVIDDSSDGVWLVGFAQLTDVRSVVQAVASVLGVEQEIGRPVAETLVKSCNYRQLLIVLDNCEHLLPACAHLTKRLLQSCPGVKILATSREPLRVAGETCYHVQALTSPISEGRSYFPA